MSRVYRAVCDGCRKARLGLGILSGEAMRFRLGRDRFGGWNFKDRGELRAPAGGGAAPHRSRWRIEYKMTWAVGRWVHDFVFAG